MSEIKSVAQLVSKVDQVRAEMLDCFLQWSEQDRYAIAELIGEDDIESLRTAPAEYLAALQSMASVGFHVVAQDCTNRN